MDTLSFVSFFVLRKFLVVLLHAAGRVDQFLRSGKKRVAVGAKLNADVADG